jgi:hypothetical protein
LISSQSSLPDAGDVESFEPSVADAAMGAAVIATAAAAVAGTATVAAPMEGAVSDVLVDTVNGVVDAVRG